MHVLLWQYNAENRLINHKDTVKLLQLYIIVYTLRREYFNQVSTNVPVMDKPGS